MSESIELAAKTAVLQQVAAAYVKAIASGEPPIKAVTNSLGLPRATAIRRIRRAREMGLIPDEMRPIFGKKVVAVARELDVSPEALRKAVIKHAGGDLRVT